ncbi:RteC domain-containing protein [Formosa sp. A9]|uniref:RteC domain-containing protein n=1 Tax=Formosa sp. A9 TaxID=3442641 RepID=UPI003EBD559F
MNYTKIVTNLDTQLAAIESRPLDILQKSEQGISYTEQLMKQLRSNVIKKGFATAKEEIFFFKHIKPKVYSRLIYYVKLYRIESKRPRGSSKFQIKYLNQNIHRLQAYFHDNHEFYRYFRRGATVLDDLYFMRGRLDLRIPSESYAVLIDDKFSTCQDNAVARILAFDLLIHYLQKEIKKLENLKFTTDSDDDSSTFLHWTGSKTELIELIYALNCSRVINSGTADIKEIASFFEKYFNIELGNYYHTFIEIRARKSSNTKFLNRLTESLKAKLIESDQ